METSLGLSTFFPLTISAQRCSRKSKQQCGLRGGAWADLSTLGIDFRWLAQGDPHGVGRDSAHRPGLQGPQVLCPQCPGWRLVTWQEGSRVFDPSSQLLPAPPSTWPLHFLPGVEIGGNEQRVRYISDREHFAHTKLFCAEVAFLGSQHGRLQALLPFRFTGEHAYMWLHMPPT